jgi:hypothetical protein
LQRHIYHQQISEGNLSGNIRKYHGLLVASLHPPVERVVTLSRLEETVLAADGAAVHHAGRRHAA